MTSDKRMSPPSLVFKMQIAHFITEKFPKQQRKEYPRENYTKVQEVFFSRRNVDQTRESGGNRAYRRHLDSISSALFCLVCVPPCLRERSAGSFPEQRLVIEPNRHTRHLAREFEIGALFLRLRLPSTLIYHENGGRWKHRLFAFVWTENNLKNGAIRKRWAYDIFMDDISLPLMSSNTNSKWPMIVALSNSSGLVWTGSKITQQCKTYLHCNIFKATQWNLDSFSSKK